MAEGFNPHHLTRAELWILGWLERELGDAPDVYTDLDFHDGIVNRGHYRTLVLNTHPEYWTEQMYDNLEAFLRSGGSLLYLGGNGIYEKTRYLGRERTEMEFFEGRDVFSTGSPFECPSSGSVPGRSKSTRALAPRNCHGTMRGW